jgi:inorganic phosphate transporter, PiT family
VTNFQLLAVIVVVTLAFEFTNGWHDAASSIATVVSTRVLRPLWAVAWAAFWNFFAAFVFGTAVAKTMGSGLVNLKMVNETVLLAGLLGAIVWNYATIRMGLPASSSHALMGGYGGAAVAAVGFKAILIHGWILPVIFIFLGPLIGMAAGLIVTVITSWIVRRQPPRRVDKWFRRLQLVSAGAFSLGHGTNDAQKGMGIITAALVSSGTLSSYVVPYWVIICCHLAIAGGTMAGGWRVVKTMGQKITKLTPFSGFAAETAAAVTLMGTAAAGIPVSTTHVITGAIVGVGASRRITAVRWGVTERIMWAWVLTIPGAGLMGALFYFGLRRWIH